MNHPRGIARFPVNHPPGSPSVIRVTLGRVATPDFSWSADSSACFINTLFGKARRFFKSEIIGMM